MVAFFCVLAHRELCYLSVSLRGWRRYSLFDRGVCSEACDLFFFFFSSRRRHTRSDRDWSSDVCSSDLDETRWDDQVLKEPVPYRTLRAARQARATLLAGFTTLRDLGTEGADWIKVYARSEERRVGKECRSRWSPYH